MADLNKLKLIAEPNMSNWMKEAQWRQDNSYWLKRSAEIALKILVTLNRKKMTKEDLNAITQISKVKINKMLKGKYDFSLKELMKLEKALDIEFVVKHYPIKKGSI